MYILKLWKKVIQCRIKSSWIFYYNPIHLDNSLLRFTTFSSNTNSITFSQDGQHFLLIAFVNHILGAMLSAGELNTNYDFFFRISSISHIPCN